MIGGIGNSILGKASFINGANEIVINNAILECSKGSDTCKYEVPEGTRKIEGETIAIRTDVGRCIGHINKKITRSTNLIMIFLHLKGVVNRVRKYVLILSLLFSIVILLTSCSIFNQDKFEYTGEYPELFSIAVNSILGARTQYTNSWGFYLMPDIEILDKDTYGRVLFSYSDGNLNFPSLLIMQQTSGNYVYFYPHYNFISSSKEYNWEFTSDEIEELKKMNNWNEKIGDNDAFVRVRIVRHEEESLVPRYLLVEVYHEMFSDNNSALPTNIQNINSRMIFLRADDFGRSVYLATGTIHGGNFVVIFQSDNSFDLELGILELTNRYRYQTELRLFMNRNGWNMPILN